MLNTINSMEKPDASLGNEDINEILRGEISAVETYAQIADQITDSPEALRVKEFHQEHLKSVEYWKNEAKNHFQVPEKKSGVWGSAVQAFVGASKVFGDKATLMTIKKGEEHGLKNYREMLNSDKLNPLQKSKIKYTFIPMQEKHINSLSAMIKIS